MTDSAQKLENAVGPVYVLLFGKFTSTLVWCCPTALLSLPQLISSQSPAIYSQLPLCGRKLINTSPVTPQSRLLSLQVAIADAQGGTSNPDLFGLDTIWP